MRRFLSLALATAFVFLGLGVALAVDFPNPPLVYTSVDNFYYANFDAQGNLYISHIYCYVIKGKTIVNKNYPDNGFDYMVIHRLVPREDGLLVQEKYPSTYYYDADGDGILSKEETLFDLEADGWNGNEITYEEYQLRQGISS